MAILRRTAGRRQRALEILVRLKKRYPDARCSLDYASPVQLLVATILSAQCTDERVNQVTPALFTQFPDAPALAAAPLETLESLIRSTGFYRNKARHIQGACQRIVAEYSGQVPRRMEDLLTLPGVARKTANVVLAHAFGINAGVTVDTHVKRLTYRLGLTTHTEPERIERDLMELIPRPDWENWSIRLIYHGRAVCNARKPLCSECLLADLCPSSTHRVDLSPSVGSAPTSETPVPAVATPETPVPASVAHQDSVGVGTP
ncbi:MAG: endonuclease III [Gloeomargaritaceae cyanobacterium C42_A2020_066]|nr:endonuclease III [Gloeomargaritaceae cyanobacterium C42_A2020_066]